MIDQGHAFLLHGDAISILRELNAGRHTPIPGEKISLFSLRRPDGQEIKPEELQSGPVLKGLTSSCSWRAWSDYSHPGTIRRGRSFSHFIKQQGRVVAAAFTNGDIEYGDVFIGGDGGKSKVRKTLFGNFPPPPHSIKK